MVTFAHSCCLYLDARSCVSSELVKTCRLAEVSLDLVPGLAGDVDEDLEAKEGEQLDQTC